MTTTAPTIRAAIYARKSTDQRDVAEDAKSITSQIERSREFAMAKGWVVADEHVYVDDNVSAVGLRVAPATCA